MPSIMYLLLMKVNKLSCQQFRQFFWKYFRNLFWLLKICEEFNEFSLSSIEQLFEPDNEIIDVYSKKWDKIKELRILFLVNCRLLHFISEKLNARKSLLNIKMIISVRMFCTQQVRTKFSLHIFKRSLLSLFLFSIN